MDRTRIAAGVCTLALAAVVAGCGGSSGSPTAPSPSAASGGTTTRAAAASSTGAAASGKVSANTASENQIADALRAHGVSNPERWAD